MLDSSPVIALLRSLLLAVCFCVARPRRRSCCSSAPARLTALARAARAPRHPPAPAQPRAAAPARTGAPARRRHRGAPPMAEERGDRGDGPASYTRWWVDACPFAEECNSSSWARLKGSFCPYGGGVNRRWSRTKHTKRRHRPRKGFVRLGLRQSLVYPALFFEPEPKAARVGSAPWSAA